MEIKPCAPTNKLASEAEISLCRNAGSGCKLGGKFELKIALQLASFKYVVAPHQCFTEISAKSSVI